LGVWRHGNIWWLGAPSGPSNSWKAIARRCCISHATRHRLFACLNQRSCLGVCGQCLVSQRAVPHNLCGTNHFRAAGPPSPVPSWVELARAVLLRVCPSLHPLQTLLCAAFCAPEAVVTGLFPVAFDQRMLVPVGALRCMLLAIACLGHIQQRPGSDLSQLWAGVLHWLTSPGLPAVEVFEVTSHLVWTHQTTDDPRQLLGPSSPLSVRHAYTLLTESRQTARCQAHRRFVVQTLWTQCSH
jgi:hypothetical protein